MDLAPWKLMLGVAVVLVIFGSLVSLGISEPVEIAMAMLFGGVLIVTTYLGYRLGNMLGERRS